MGRKCCRPGFPWSIGGIAWRRELLIWAGGKEAAERARSSIDITAMSNAQNDDSPAINVEDDPPVAHSRAVRTEPGVGQPLRIVKRICRQTMQRSGDPFADRRLELA